MKRNKNTCQKHDNQETEKNAGDFSPLHLDEMMTVIDVKAWIAFITVLTILCAVTVWGVFGTIQLREDVDGVLVKSGKIINIYATDDCRILDFTLKPETYVHKEQVVARIEQPALVQEINMMLARGDSELEIEAKREELLFKSQIMTPEAGRIVDVYVHAGDYVSKGTKIAVISKEAPDRKAMEPLFYVPAEKMHGIRKGLSVNVYPADVNKETYGNMTGVISSVSEYPVTEQYMIDILGSEELAKEFLKNGAHYEICVNLKTDEETVTGYEWTTSMGPSKKFGNLTLCSASVIMEELHPVDLLFFSE